MLKINDWRYVISYDKNARFVLGINGYNPLICFGINPSTATPVKTDPTINRVQNFAENNGFDGYIMLNLYPQRATEPKNIDTQRNVALHQENVWQIIRILEKGPRTILAGWGSLIEERPFFIDCLYEIVLKISDCHYWVSLGLSKDGHPRHPLYIKATEEFREFDIKSYIYKYSRNNGKK